ncbi:MAG: DUF2478 domain-containing protein [Chloroflexi bacterium]|nr:DUF2478 domain-containing protein [Chloroflexota bacterium]
MNVLLTGKRGVGKTTVCQAVAELARACGFRAQGLLTPALHDGNGAKIGFEALDEGSGQRWLLAHTEQSLDGPRIGPYTFDAAGLARAVAVLQQACAAPSDLLIVDEIGPLELEKGEGFAPVLDSLPLTGPGHVLIVVRPALLPALRSRLNRADFSIYTVTEDNRDILPAHIAQELWPHENFKLQNPNFKP